MPNAFLYGVGGKLPTLSELSVSANGTYSASDYSVDGFSVVNVSVQGSAVLEDGDLYLMGLLQNVSTDFTGLTFGLPMTEYSGPYYNYASQSFGYFTRLSKITYTMSSTSAMKALFNYKTSSISCALICVSCSISDASFTAPDVDFYSYPMSLVTQLHFNTMTGMANSNRYIWDYNISTCTSLGTGYSTSILSLYNLIVPNYTGSIYTLNGHTSVYIRACNKIIMPNASITLTSVKFSCTELEISGSNNLRIDLPHGLYNSSYSDFVYMGITRSLSINGYISAVTDLTGTLLNSISLTVGNIGYVSHNMVLDYVYLSTQSISSNQFVDCKALKTVILPIASTIYMSAFKDCIKLSEFTLLYSNVATISYDVFKNTPIIDSTIWGYYGSIYVPSSLVDSYKVATNWVVYSDRITSYIEE